MKLKFVNNWMDTVFSLIEIAWAEVYNQEKQLKGTQINIIILGFGIVAIVGERPLTQEEKDIIKEYGTSSTPN